MGSFIDLTLFTGREKQFFVHNTRIKTYPNGATQVLVCDQPIFGRKGWEADPLELGVLHSTGEDGYDKPRPPKEAKKPREGVEHRAKDIKRSVRRARAQVRDYALCTPFTYFVTLTLDKEKVDRYDIKTITKKLRVWADNQVRRKGLTYILVPERHKDGAIHFHGFFNGALETVDSGTMTAPGWKSPRRPRSAAQRRKWEAEGAHVVYNLPAWTLGFTTAIELYGEYDAAVSYVCKYIGKDMDGGSRGPDAQPCEKIGGRWYYSGGDLQLPAVTYDDSNVREVAATEGAYRFDIPEAGLSFVQVTAKGAPIYGRNQNRTTGSGSAAAGSTAAGCGAASPCVRLADRADRPGRAGSSGRDPIGDAAIGGGEQLCLDVRFVMSSSARALQT